MPACIKFSRQGWVGRCWRYSLGWWLAGFFALSWANDNPGGFAVYSANTRLQDHLYLLNATLNYQLSDAALEALHSGVPLTIVLNIEVKDARWYAWSKRVAELSQRYRFSYHALTGDYLLTYLNTGLHESFSHLNRALAKISQLTDFPLLDQHLIDTRQEYSVELETYLDIEALPAPLRPVAYFSSQWRLISDTYTCPLEP